jgi:malate dehydrogenase
VSSFPVVSQGGEWSVVPGLELRESTRARLDASVAELASERDAVVALGLLSP